jgi:hypothetical protein
MTSQDVIKAAEAVRVAAAVPLSEGLGWRINWRVAKYSEAATRIADRHGFQLPTDEDFALLGLDPYAVGLVEGNLLTTAGIGRIATLLNAGTGNKISSTTARVGVGNGGGTAAIGDTDLSASAGSANRWFQTCTVTTPSNVLTFAATFGSSDGNFAWNEFGIDIDTATVSSGNTVGAVLLNHKTSIAQGTKASGQTWNATATVTFS